MKAGAGKAEVDLAGVLPFDGFDAVQHPLVVRALVLEEGIRICLVSMELTSIREDLLAALREAAGAATGAAGAQLWVTATHCFSAPHTRTPGHLGSEEERERNVALQGVYAKAVREACTSAVAHLAPADVEVGQGTTQVNVNRDVPTPAGWWLGRNPEGFSDHVLPVVRISSEEGRTIAIVFSADVQSSVLSGSRDSKGQRLVSGDLAGFAAASLERSHPGTVALFLEGCAGDQMPREAAITQTVAADGTIVCTDVHEEGYRMLHQLGSELAGDVEETLDGMGKAGGAGLVAASSEVSLPGKEREEFSTLAPHAAIEWHASDPISTTVSLVRIGGIVLAGVEPEVASSFGHALRTHESGPFVVATMVNGAQKYLPDAESYDHITYEAMNSGFAPGADALLADAVLRETKKIEEGECA